MKIHFYKYQGTGNDFVMIDNRACFFPKENQALVAFLCNRRFGIGADGLILLENDENYDFRMIYYNSDGNQSSMCGNGGRCTVAFAKKLGIITDKTLFIATDGTHFAEISEENDVKLQMKDVNSVEIAQNYTFLNTGSPHHIEMVADVATINVKDKGSEIRYGALYREKGGSNVNFVQKLDNQHFKVRTYERGVEDETLSCGTGVTAAAIAMYHTAQTTDNQLVMQTEGGELTVSFQRENAIYKNVFLSGKATFVFEGEIFYQK